MICNQKRDKSSNTKFHRISEFDMIRDVFNNPNAQQDLIKLYSYSQSEYTRNGKLCMEIGSAREKDLIAVLQKYIGDNLNPYIDNSELEDFVLNNEKFSIKHSSAPFTKCSFKLKWTADSDKAQNTISKFLTCDPKYYTNMILVHIDVISKQITIYGLTIDNIIDQVKIFGDTAFMKKSGTNNRGISFTGTFVKQLLQTPYFQITINDVILDQGLDGIARRRLLIK